MKTTEKESRVWAKRKDERKGSSESRPKDSRYKNNSDEHCPDRGPRCCHLSGHHDPSIHLSIHHPSLPPSIHHPSIYPSIHSSLPLSIHHFSIHPFNKRVLKMFSVPNTVPGTGDAHIKRCDKYSHMCHNLVGERERRRGRERQILVM